MLLMSWSTFRERWQVFIGAIVTVCLGVALFQSSLLLLISAAAAPIPPGLSEADERALRDGYSGAVSLLGIELGLASFVAVFIVSSTFAFTVAQRRRDLALLRLTGASRGQVRVLLIGEALLLGSIGAALGVLAGLPVMGVQAWLLRRLELVPSPFVGQWRSWVIAASVGLGLIVAVCGVLTASARAARVRPLEALRETGRAARVMTLPRWIIGLIFLAGSITMMVLVPAVGGDGAIAMSTFISMLLVVAFAALAPLIVPLVSRAVRVFAVGHLGQLAHANLRDGVRRSASTAAPIMVLVAFAAGLGGAVGIISGASRLELTRTLRADLVVPAAEAPLLADLRTIDGVAAVSREVPVPFDLGLDDGEGGMEYEAADGLAVDAADYLMTHRLDVRAGDLAGLHGDSVAMSPSYDSTGGWHLGDTLAIRLDGQPRRLHIVALLPDTIAGPYFLFPSDIVDAARTAPRYLVRVAPGTDVAAVATAIAAAAGAPVLTVGEWISRNADDQDRMNNAVMVALLGVSLLYTVVAMINAVVVSASDRRAEFASARVSGLTRGQVVRMALYESLTVLVVGLILGGLAAVGTMLGFTTAIRGMTGITVFSAPWPLLTGLTLGAAVIVGVTTVLTTVAATRTPPIRLVAAHE